MAESEQLAELRVAVAEQVTGLKGVLSLGAG